MAKGLQELEQFWLNSAELWQRPGNISGNICGDGVMRSFDVFCTTGSAK
jgi:hypothetical protein